MIISRPQAGLDDCCNVDRGSSRHGPFLQPGQGLQHRCMTPAMIDKVHCNAVCMVGALPGKTHLHIKLAKHISTSTSTSTSSKATGSPHASCSFWEWPTQDLMTSSILCSSSPMLIQALRFPQLTQPSAPHLQGSRVTWYQNAYIWRRRFRHDRASQAGIGKHHSSCRHGHTVLHSHQSGPLHCSCWLKRLSRAAYTPGGHSIEGMNDRINR